MSLPLPKIVAVRSGAAIKLLERPLHQPMGATWNACKLLGASMVLLACTACDRVELRSIPQPFVGIWEGGLEQPERLIIRPSSIVWITPTGQQGCLVERVVSYETGLLAQNKNLALICDARSTKTDQAWWQQNGVIAPPDYRKQYRITFPDLQGYITVSQTMYMNKGLSGSEGVYEWEVGEFFRLQ